MHKTTEPTIFGLNFGWKQLGCSQTDPHKLFYLAEVGPLFGGFVCRSGSPQLVGCIVDLDLDMNPSVKCSMRDCGVVFGRGCVCFLGVVWGKDEHWLIGP